VFSVDQSVYGKGPRWRSGKSKARERSPYWTDIRPPPTDAGFSPDGGRVATAAKDKTVVVWDVATAKKIVKLEGHEKAIDQVGFSQDGARILTVGRDRTVRVWDAVGGGAIATLRHQADVEAATFDREGKRIAL
jgi:WD40 repeat protein